MVVCLAYNIRVHNVQKDAANWANWYLFMQSPPEVHANAAETLCAVTRNATSPLAIKLSSVRFDLCYLLYEEYLLLFLIATPVRDAWKFSVPCSFVSRIFDHALEESHSKSSLVHSLSICISLLDPQRSTPPMNYSFQSQPMQESNVHVSSETVDAMLPKLGNLWMSLSFIGGNSILVIFLFCID